MITGTNAVATVLKRHGLSAAFMDPPDKELDRMAEDIRDHGLIEPIVTIEEEGERLVLDGWGRYRCCLKAEVEPRFVDFNEMKTGLTPTDFVMSRNMFRKHLTTVQRACIASEVYEGRWVKQGGYAAVIRSNRANGEVTIDEVAKVARVPPSELRAVRTIQRADPATFAKLKTGELKNPKKLYLGNPKLRVNKPHVLQPSHAAARALGPTLTAAAKLTDTVELSRLKPAAFAKQWAIWEGADKAKRIKAMKAAHQWLGEVIAAIGA
jgi:hypothetical protein